MECNLQLLAPTNVISVLQHIAETRHISAMSLNICYIE